MAAVLLQTVVATPISSTAISTGNFTTTGPNHSLIAYVRVNTTGRTATLADTLNGSWAAADRFANGVGLSAGIYSFHNITAGTTNVTATQSGASIGLGLIVEEWSGLLMPTPVDKAVGLNQASGTTNTVPTTGTLSAAPELAVSFCAVASNSAGMAVTAPFVLNQSSGLVWTANYQPASTAAITGTIWSWTNTNGNGTGIVTYQLATVGAQIAPLYTRKYVLFNT